ITYGQLDVGFGAEASIALFVLMGIADGTFLVTASYRTAVPVPAVATVDFNGDRKIDLDVATNLSRVSILLGNGDGTFQPHVDIAVPVPGAGPITTGDFNKDGKLDLAVSIFNTVAILLGNGDGTFRAPIEFPVGGGPSGLTTAD